MLTDHTLSSAAPEGRPTSTSRVPTQVHTVAIVNGTPDILSVVESMLTAGHYDVVMVESVAHAYSHIKRVQPRLVILCVRFDAMDGFQVLSMLKMDEETRDIPVLTYTSGLSERVEEEPDSSDTSSIELFSARPVVRMN